MADIPSKKSRTQLKSDLFMKSHSEQSRDTTEITSQKQTGDAGCTSSAIDVTEDLEESMPGPGRFIKCTEQRRPNRFGIQFYITL